MQHFKFVNWRIRGFVFSCNEQVNSQCHNTNARGSLVWPLFKSLFYLKNKFTLCTYLEKCLCVKNMLLQKRLHPFVDCLESFCKSFDFQIPKCFIKRVISFDLPVWQISLSNTAKKGVAFFFAKSHRNCNVTICKHGF